MLASLVQAPLLVGERNVAWESRPPPYYNLKFNLLAVRQKERPSEVKKQKF